MGFSVSGATAVILVGSLIAFSFAFTATSNGFERVSDAREDRENRILDAENTAVEIANASYDGGAGAFTLDVNNTGSTALSVPETTVLVDGAYASNATTSVDGEASTAIWLPGEQLSVVVDRDVAPDRAKIVTQNGVADTVTEVTTSG